MSKYSNFSKKIYFNLYFLEICEDIREIIMMYISHQKRDIRKYSYLSLSFNSSLSTPTFLQLKLPDLPYLSPIFHHTIPPLKFESFSSSEYYISTSFIVNNLNRRQIKLDILSFLKNQETNKIKNYETIKIKN